MKRRVTRRRHLDQARRQLAELIDAHLKRGQRADGVQERRWKPWTNNDFASILGVSPNAVANWRNHDRPTPPSDILPLLESLFGSDQKFDGRRKELKETWERATGLVPDETTEPSENCDDVATSAQWEIVDAENLGLGMAAFYVHLPPQSNSPDTFHVQVSLSMAQSPDEIEGFCVLLGLRAAHLEPTYVACQPIGSVDNANIVDRAGLFEVTGPRKSYGHLSGRLLENGTLCILQRTGPELPAITLALRSRRRDLDVVPEDPQVDISAAREKILKVFLQDCHQVDADRFIVWGRATLKRKPAP
jgi:hypothetical protein